MNSSIDDFRQKHMSINSIKVEDLPFHCPPKESNNWSMHPKVFLKFDSLGNASCPYCGASYKLA